MKPGHKSRWPAGWSWSREAMAQKVILQDLQRASGARARASASQADRSAGLSALVRASTVIRFRRRDERKK